MKKSVLRFDELKVVSFVHKINEDFIAPCCTALDDKIYLETIKTFIDKTSGWFLMQIPDGSIGLIGLCTFIVNR